MSSFHNVTMMDYINAHWYLIVLYAVFNLAISLTYISIPIMIKHIANMFNLPQVKRLLYIVANSITPVLWMGAGTQFINIYHVFFHSVPDIKLLWDGLRGMVAVFTIGKVIIAVYCSKK